MSAFKTSSGSIHDIATKRQPLYLSLIELSFQCSLETVVEDLTFLIVILIRLAVMNPRFITGS